MSTPIEKRIREKLKAKGMSVTQLAQELGVSRVALYYLFRGNFSRDMLQRISTTLSIPPHVLIAPESGSENLENREALWNAYLNSPHETRRAVDMILKIQPEIQNRKPVVMVIDDLEDNVALLKRCLRKDYDVIEFTDPQELIRELENNRTVDAIISDQRMPKMNGTDLFKRVDKLGKHIAKLIVSAYTDNKAFMDAINDTKVDAFILKPFEPEKLRERLQKILGAETKNNIQ